MACASHPTRLAVCLAAIWLAVASWASIRQACAEPATLPAGERLRWRRVFVPADRLEQVSGDAGRYIPVDAALVERLLADKPQHSARLVRSTFEARLLEDSLVEGTASLEVVHSGNEPSTLRLGPMNLAISDPVWTDAPGQAAIAGLHADGQMVALVEKSGELAWKWQLRGERREEGRIVLRPVFPRGTVTQLHLRVPLNWTVTTDRGSVERSASDEPNSGLWRIDLGRHTDPIVWITPPTVPESAALTAVIRSLHEYDITLRGMRLVAEFTVELADDPLGELSLNVDRRLHLGEILLDGRQTKWSLAEDPATGTRTLSIDAQEVLAGSDHLLRINAAARLEPSVREPLPRLAPASQCWESGRTRIHLSPELSLAAIDEGSARLVSAAQVDVPRKGELLEFEDLSSQPRIGVAVGTRGPPVDLDSGLTLHVGPRLVQFQLLTLLRLAGTTSQELALDLAPDCTVETVESNPPGHVVNWVVEPARPRAPHPPASGADSLGAARTRETAARGNDEPPKDRLVVHLGPTSETDPTIMLRVTGLRPRRSPADAVDLSALRVATWPGGTEPSLIRIVPDEGYVLKWKQGAAAVTLDEASLTERLRALVPTEPSSLLVRWRNSSRSAAVLLQPQRPRYSAQIVIDVAIDRETINETITLRCEPLGSRIDRIAVRLEQAASAGFQWSNADGESVRLEVARPSQPEILEGQKEPAAEELRIALSSPSVQPVMFKATRSRSLHERLVVPRLIPTEAASSEAKVVVRWTKDSSVTINNQGYEPVIPGESSPSSTWEKLEFQDYPRQHTPASGGNPRPQWLEISAEPRAASGQSHGQGLIWQEELNSWVYPQGTTVHLATYRLEGLASDSVSWSIPRAARVEGVWIGDRPVEGPIRVEGDRLQVPLPQDESFAQITLQFVTDEPAVGSAARRSPPWPVCSLPTLSRLWNLWLPQGLTVSGRDAKDEAAGTGHAEEGIAPWSRQQPALGPANGWHSVRLPVGTRENDWTASNWTFFPFERWQAWSWCMLVATGVAAWRARGRATMVMLVAGCLVTAVALVGPPPFSLLARGAVYGLFGGWLLRGVSPLGAAMFFRSGEHAEAPLTAERLLILMTLVFTSAGTACGDIEGGTASLLIPLDAEGRVAGRNVFVPDTLLRELYHRDATRPDALREWLLRDVTYRGAITIQAGPNRIVVENLRVDFDLEVLKSESTVAIPFAIRDAHWSVGRAELDGRAVEVRWAPDAEVLSLGVAQVGPCRLTIQLIPTPEQSGPIPGFHLKTPQVPSSRLVLDVPSESARATLSSLPGMPRLGRNPYEIVSHLGPTDTLYVGHPEHRLGGPYSTSADISELYWLSIRPGSVRLTARFRIEEPNLRPGQIVVETDPKLRLLPLTEELQERMRIDPGPPQRLAVGYDASNQGSAVAVELPFVIRDQSGLGQVHMPEIQLLPFRSGKRLFAVSVDPALQYDELQAGTFDRLEANDFLRSWGETDPPPTVAYEVPHRTAGPVLAIRPRQPRATCRSEVETTFGLEQAAVRFRSQISISDGSWNFCHIAAPRGFNSQAVAARSGATAHRIRWAQDVSGQITVLFDQPISGPLELELTGVESFGASEQLALPRFALSGCQTVETTHRVYREHDVLVEIKGPVAEENPEGRVVEQADVDRRWIGRFSNAGLGPGVTVRVLPNRCRADGTLSTRMEPTASGWSAWCEWKVQVREGALDELLLEVPKEVSCDTGSAGDAVIASDAPAADPDRKLVAFYPRQVWTGTHRLQFRAVWTSPEGLPVKIPCLTPLAPAAVVHDVLLPERIAEQPVGWSTSGLDPAKDRSHDASQSGAAGNRWKSYRVTAYPYAAETRGIMRKDLRPAIRLADVRVAVSSSDQEDELLAALELLPAGNAQCEIRLPDECSLRHLTLASRSATAQRIGSSSWRVHLQSSTKPQRLEVLFSQPAPAGQRRHWTCPQVLLAGEPLEVHDRRWTLFLPRSLRLVHSNGEVLSDSGQQFTQRPSGSQQGASPPSSSPPTNSELFERMLGDGATKIRLALSASSTGPLQVELARNARWTERPWPRTAILASVLTALALGLRSRWADVQEAFFRWPNLIVVAVGLATWRAIHPGLFTGALLAAPLLFALARKPRFWYSTARPSTE